MQNEKCEEKVSALQKVKTVSAQQNNRNHLVCSQLESIHYQTQQTGS